jgi:aryl-alcohol dehydrogenase-like predicted oxidoreductase
LDRLPHSQRSALTIASKFGITWDGGRSTVDHSYEALARSLDNTLVLLPELSVIQVHKASRAALLSPGVDKALQYAAQSGVRAFGASVSDLDSFRLAIYCERFTHIQLPLNTANRTLLPLLEEALDRSITLVINRPFNMGALLTKGNSASAAMVDSFRFVTEHVHSSIVLTGTANPVHLRDNIRAFRASTGSS